MVRNVKEHKVFSIRSGVQLGGGPGLDSALFNK